MASHVSVFFRQKERSISAPQNPSASSVRLVRSPDQITNVNNK
ncbi:hypothetical protein BRC2024_ULFKEANI_CDS_0240 [Acinetobacter phage vB_AbaM_Konradin-v2]